MKDFYKKYKQIYQNENEEYKNFYRRRYENNGNQFPNQMKSDNLNINHNIEINLEEKNEIIKNEEEEFDQTLSLNDKFKSKNIKLEKNNKNELFFYVPEENLHGLYTISLQDAKKSVQLNYLKHSLFLGNKRNNENNIENNKITEQNNNNAENNIDIIFKNIFKNRKNFYADFEIRKNLNKEYYNKFIDDIAYKYNNALFDVVEFNNYIYTNYKSLEKISLSNISSCYLKERNITNANLYFSKKDIIINNMFFLNQ